MPTKITLFFALLGMACTPKTYSDFSFRKINDHVALRALPDEDRGSVSICPPESYCTAHWISKKYGLYMALHHGEEPLKRLYVSKSDTFNLTEMLGEDTAIIKNALFVQIQDGNSYEIADSKGEIRYLFNSMFVGDMSGQSRVNLVFEIKNGEITHGNAYHTDSFLLENDPCTSCVTDYNHDLKIDFIRFLKREAPVYYLNFEGGTRQKYPSGFHTVLDDLSEDGKEYRIRKSRKSH